jgi:hypothetical protein
MENGELTVPSHQDLPEVAPDQRPPPASGPCRVDLFSGDVIQMDGTVDASQTNYLLVHGDLKKAY